MKVQEPAALVTRRVRLFRKRRREDLKRSNAFIWGLKTYFRARDLTTEWAFAEDVYKNMEVLSIQIPFAAFMEGILGSKKKKIKPIRSIEVATLIDPSGEQILLIRPVRIPSQRRRK